MLCKSFENQGCNVSKPIPSIPQIPDIPKSMNFYFDGVNCPIGYIDILYKGISYEINYFVSKHDFETDEINGLDVLNLKELVDIEKYNYEAYKEDFEYDKGYFGPKLERKQKIIDAFKTLKML